LEAVHFWTDRRVRAGVGPGPQAGLPGLTQRPRPESVPARGRWMGL